MLCALFGGVLDSEVINDRGEVGAVSGMTKETGCGSLVIAVNSEVGNELLLC